MATLQEKLLQAGLINAKQAKQIAKEKRQQAKQTPKGQSAVDDTKEAAKNALAEKSARAREVNLQQQQKAAAKAIAAQIIQLIEVNRIDRRTGDIAYQFADDKKIKKLYVTTALVEQLSRGLIAIVKCRDQYELIPAAVADKIRQRDEGAVLLHNQPSNTDRGDDDPYADYKIPDDLMW